MDDKVYRKKIYKMRILRKILLSIIPLFAVNSFSQQFDGSFTEKNYYTEIKYEFINEKIIIPVEIEGEQYRFLLDTGAPNFITKKLNDKIKTNYIKSVPVADASNKKDALQLVTISQLTIGDVTFKNSNAIVTSSTSNFLFDCFEIDGFIGSNLLQNSIIQIQPRTQTLIITDNKKKLSLNSKNAVKLKLYFNEKKPFIWIKLRGVDKGKEQVLVDTGMKGLYELSNRNLRVFEKKEIITKKQSTTGTMGTGFLGAEKTTNYFKVQIPEIRINNTSFKNITVETTNSLNSRIGNDLLKYGTITLDFKNGKFYFNSIKNNVDVSRKTHGFNPTLLDNKLVIGVIWDEELKSKMSFGDQILKLNDVDIEDIDQCDFITKESMFGSQEKLKLVILNKNGQKKIILTEKK